MTEGDMKFEALKLQISDPNMVDNAERLVRIAYDMSSSTALPMYKCWYYLTEAIRTLNVIDANKAPKLDGQTANAILETLRMPE